MKATMLTHIGSSKPLTTTDQPPIRRSRCTSPNTARITAAMDVNGFMMSRCGNGDECGGKKRAENQAIRFHDCTPWFQLFTTF